MKAKKQCRATTAAGIVKRVKKRKHSARRYRPEDKAAWRNHPRARSGPKPKRRLMRDIMMMRFTENEMHGSQITDKIEKQIGREQQDCKETQRQWL
ncbi:MAG: hypothetical protein ACLU7D_06670 [Collinsella sp.]